MNSVYLVQASFLLLTLFVSINAEGNDDIARKTELKNVNVELSKNTTVSLSNNDSKPSLKEQIYKMMFKRDAKPKEEKKEDEAKKEDSTTSAPSSDAKTSDAKPSGDKHSKGHKSHHKKHKHSHKHHKSGNETEVDWHSIG